MPVGITRRRLLESGILCLGGFALCNCAESANPSIVDHLSSFPAARRVGQAYLAGSPRERDADRLAELLSLERGWTLVEAEIRSDYREGRVVRISGWPLSLTEVRIYALASLRAPG